MCLEGIKRVHVGCLEVVQGVSQVGLVFISLKEQQPLMDFENGVIVKIYKF